MSHNDNLHPHKCTAEQSAAFYDSLLLLKCHCSKKLGKSDNDEALRVMSLARVVVYVVVTIEVILKRSISIYN